MFIVLRKKTSFHTFYHELSVTVGRTLNSWSHNIKSVSLERSVSSGLINKLIYASKC